MAEGPRVGYVKLFRKLLDWQWIGDPNVVAVFVQIVLRCNREPKMWQGIEIPAGSFFTSRDTIAGASGLSEKQVRRALDVMKRAGTIDTSRAGLGQLVSLRNWEEYQEQPPEQGRRKAEPGAGRGPKQGRSRAATEEVREVEKGRSREPVPTVQGANGQMRMENMEGDPPKTPPPGSKPGPNPDVQAVVDHLTAAVIEKKIAPALDPPIAGNRRFAYLLINKVKADYPNHDPLEAIKRLIDYAVGDPWHGPRCTKVSNLFYNLHQIAAEARAKKSNPKTQTDDDRKLELAARLAEFAQQSAGNV